VSEQLRWGVVSSACVVVALSIGVHWGPVGMARCYAAFAVVVEGVLLWGATRRGPVTLSNVLCAAYPVFISAAIIGLALSYTQLELSGLGIGERFVVPITLLASYAICGACLLCFPAGQQIIRDIWSLRDTLWPAALT
jgi:polysaccharide transporter, PST family